MTEDSTRFAFLSSGSPAADKAIAELRGLAAGGTAEDVDEIPDEELDVTSELTELKQKLQN